MVLPPLLLGGGIVPDDNEPHGPNWWERRGIIMLARFVAATAAMIIGTIQALQGNVIALHPIMIYLLAMILVVLVLRP